MFKNSIIIIIHILRHLSLEHNGKLPFALNSLCIFDRTHKSSLCGRTTLLVQRFISWLDTVANDSFNQFPIGKIHTPSSLKFLLEPVFHVGNTACEVPINITIVPALSGSETLLATLSLAVIIRVHAQSIFRWFDCCNLEIDLHKILICCRFCDGMRRLRSTICCPNSVLLYEQLF